MVLLRSILAAFLHALQVVLLLLLLHFGHTGLHRILLLILLVVVEVFVPRRVVILGLLPLLIITPPQTAPLANVPPVSNKNILINSSFQISSLFFLTPFPPITPSAVHMY